MDELLRESLRIFFLIIIPLLLVSIITSVITSFLQSAIRNSDSVIGYGVKILGISAIFSITAPAVKPLLQQLIVLCIKQL